MRIHVVNPNTTVSMTPKIGAAAKAAASPGVEVSAANPDFGPPSIEGYFDEAFAIPGLIAEIAKAASRRLCRRLLRRYRARGGALRDEAPVIGIGEAAFHMASLIAAKFSVVTTLSRSIPPIEHNLVKYGLAPAARGCAPPMFRCSRSKSRARRAAHDRSGNRARARRGRRRGDRARLRRHDRSRPRPRGRLGFRCSTASPARSASPRAWCGWA